MNAPGSPSSALQITYFLAPCRHGLPGKAPLLPGGESRAAAAAQARGLHLLDHRLGAHRGERSSSAPRSRRGRGTRRCSRDRSPRSWPARCASAWRGRVSVGAMISSWTGDAADEVALDDPPRVRLVHVAVQEHPAVGLAHLDHRLRVAGADAARGDHLPGQPFFEPRPSRVSRTPPSPLRRCRRSSCPTATSAALHAFPLTAATIFATLSPVSRP